ncbi:hypothetical protein [Levilactobacillus sp. N40-8-2]
MSLQMVQGTKHKSYRISLWYRLVFKQAEFGHPATKESNEVEITNN